MTHAPVGLMGKHPEYGDFLRAGLSDHVVDALNGWLDGCLPTLRDQMGQGWADFWDQAQDLRFWIGRAVLGRTLIGVLRPSRDRVGRRFPLLLVAEGVDHPAPLGAAGDQTPWEVLSEHLDDMQPGQGSAALLNGLDLSLPAEGEAAQQAGPVLWAHHPGGDLLALLHSAEGPDADRARLTRSYWWAPGYRDKTVNRAANWLGCPGLPEAQALAWLLAGVPGEAPQDGEEGA